MNTPQRLITDRELRAWLAKGAVDRGVGEGLTFVASHTAAMAGRASWVLRYRLNGRAKEKVRTLSRPAAEGRTRTRPAGLGTDRSRRRRRSGQADRKGAAAGSTPRQRLGEVWFAKYIAPRYKHPEVVARLLRRHIDPAIGAVAPADVRLALALVPSPTTRCG